MWPPRRARSAASAVPAAASAPAAAAARTMMAAPVELCSWPCVRPYAPELAFGSQAALNCATMRAR